MNNKTYFPGVKKRLLTLKVKKFGTFSAIYMTIIALGISGNFYLKSKDLSKDTLFWKPENKMTLLAIQSNAMSTNMDDLIKERDVLLAKLQEREKITPIITMPPTQQKPTINKKINVIAHNLGGLMTGNSTYLYNKCMEYDVDPLLVAAIIKHESTNGTSRAIRTQNNIAGFMGDNGLMDFKSIHDGIDFMVVLLRKHYMNEGFDSIEKIQKKYCPIGAKNDPKGLNKYWLPNVKEYYETMVKESV